MVTIEEIKDPKQAKEIMDKLKEECFFSFKFEMNDKEKASARDWIKNHDCKEYFKSSTGEHFAYEFMPGGLCTGIKVRCIFCEKSIDVTDMENL